ncbi:MAG TPA: Na-translocating system protein MpsB, partial [Flavobacteriales bacterium]|nr:Na-translocating system protein MpsB [Flavobacteriales bacterium]
ARVFCFMANHSGVRERLRANGIDIPAGTRFLGALHDTTRDEIAFYDEAALGPAQSALHGTNKSTFMRALVLNAKERSRRFESVDTSADEQEVLERVRRRSVSLFEPRPELNHATNAACIIGRRSLTLGLFLDRRSFLNSFDAHVDPDGTYLLGILNAAAPVCGGINLEYFFSRMDNQKLGAGTKLPHNVMGLIGVANGIEGDLRPGLPSQMIEVHDPVRLMILVEHRPEVVLNTITKVAATFEWFKNEWVHLLAVDPDTRAMYRFTNGAFEPFEPMQQAVPHTRGLFPQMEREMDNMHVHLIDSD